MMMMMSAEKKPPRWKVTVPGWKRAVAVFDTKADATAFCKQIRKERVSLGGDCPVHVGPEPKASVAISRPAKRRKPKFLEMSEITEVLKDLKRRGRRSVNSRQNLTIFRLATCCGLRACEIVNLNLSDVVLSVARPYVRVRVLPGNKSREPRDVSLWTDGDTLEDIRSWRVERVGEGAKRGDPFLCAQRACDHGKRLTRLGGRDRFRVACRILGEERLDSLTLHHGRHSYGSHMLNAGKSLAVVRDALGHSSSTTTDIYTHAVQDDTDKPGSVFAAKQNPVSTLQQVTTDFLEGEAERRKA